MNILVPRKHGRPASALRGVRPLSWDIGEFDRLFSELGRGLLEPTAAAAEVVFRPDVDVQETDTEYRVSAELPGLDKKDFEISLDGDVLTLRGEKRVERDTEREGYRHVERASGRFERRFHLPSDVDANKIAASYEAGVLVVTLPKAESAKPRTIEVTAG